MLNLRASSSSLSAECSCDRGNERQLCLLVRFYKSAVSATFVEEGIDMSMEKISEHEVFFFVNQTRPILFIDTTLELLKFSRGSEKLIAAQMHNIFGSYVLEPMDNSNTDECQR